MVRSGDLGLLDAIRVNSSFVGGNSFLESGLESAVL